MNGAHPSGAAPVAAHSETASLALQNLADHPARATVSGISNAPYLFNFAGPAEIHRALIELQDDGLVLGRAGRWRVTERGRKLAAAQAAARRTAGRVR